MREKGYGKRLFLGKEGKNDTENCLFYSRAGNSVLCLKYRGEGVKRRGKAVGDSNPDYENIEHHIGISFSTPEMGASKKTPCGDSIKRISIAYL